MKLTMQQEADLLLQYAPMAKRMIRDYCAACNLDVVAIGDDLLQEAYVELLIQIRSVECEEEIPLVKLKLVGAIFNTLRRMSLIVVPKNRFKQLRNTFRNEVFDEPVHGSLHCSEEDMVFMTAFSAFMDRLDERERYVITKKLEKCPHRELVSHFGIENVMTVTRILRKVREEFEALLTI